MSDNVSDEEQQQQMQEIFICADVWLEVFAFVSPLELGHLMALISDRFDVLVDEHFKLRKWSLSSLQILRAIDGNDAEIAINNSGELLPIPQGPLPSKVTGFEEIGISYVDQTVIEFLQRIRRLFDSGGTNVYLATSDDESRSWEIIQQNIWPLVNDNICRFVTAELYRLRQFSPTILRDCAKLRCIASFEPEFPAEDNAEASSNQAVAKWLLTAREDGLPKTLFCLRYSGGLDELKTAFVNASEPVNFIILLRAFAVIEPFELKNNSTGERMTSQQMEDEDENWWLLVRCPIGREEAKWAKWEDEAIQWPWMRMRWYRQWNRIYIDFKDSDIGDGKVEAKAGRKCLIA